MTKEMYAANVKNWLMKVAEGAKAAHTSIQFADAESKDSLWKVEAKCYDTFNNGVAIHRLRELAESINEPIKFEAFKEGDYFHGTYNGYYYIEMFGVRFYDFGDRVSTDEGK